MGYLTQYYSKIIKHPSWLYFWERRESRVSVRLMRHLYRDIFKKIPQEVKFHRVTKALNDLKLDITHIAMIVGIEGKLAINILVQQDKELDIIKRIEDYFESEVKKIRKLYPFFAKQFEELKKEFVAIIVKEMNEFINYERNEYKELFTIIDAAEKDDYTFMLKMRNVLKDKRVSLGRYWVMRGDLREFRNNERALMNYERSLRIYFGQVKDLMNLIGKPTKGGGTEQRKNELVFKKIELLKECIHNISRAIHLSLKHAYHSLKRVFSLMSIFLYYLDTLTKEEVEWIKKNVIPGTPAKEGINSLEELKERLVKEARAVAQAIRIMIHEAQNIEKIA